jgi:hypothetical protein
MLDMLSTDTPIAQTDVKVVIQADGVIRVQSEALFKSPDSPICQRFLRRIFLDPAIRSVAIMAQASAFADLRFDTAHAPKQVLRRLAGLLSDRNSNIVADRNL